MDTNNLSHSGLISKKISGLEEARKAKLTRLSPPTNNLTAEDLQHELSNLVDMEVRKADDGSLYQTSYTTTLDDNGNQVVEASRVPYSGNVAGVYIDNTKDGEYKLGIRRGDKTFQDRYTPGLDGYGWAPGERGVTVDDGALLDINVPESEAKRFEYLTHSNVGQIKNRAADKDTKDLYGPGYTEYTTDKAPMWNIDYIDNNKPLDKSTYVPEKPAVYLDKKDVLSNIVARGVDSDGMAGEAVDIGQSSLIQEYGKINKALRKGSRWLADKAGISEETINEWLPKADSIGTIGFGIKHHPN